MNYDKLLWDIIAHGGRWYIVACHVASQKIVIRFLKNFIANLSSFLLIKKKSV